MQPCIFQLPEVTMVAGDHQILEFTLYRPSGALYNAGMKSKHCTATFSVCDYSAKNGRNCFELTPTIIPNDDGVWCIMHIEIPAEETYQLDPGRYIYQIGVMDELGHLDVPKHGILNISSNIDDDDMRLWIRKPEDEGGGGFFSDVVAGTDQIAWFRSGKAFLMKVMVKQGLSFGRVLVVRVNWLGTGDEDPVQSYDVVLLENSLTLDDTLHFFKATGTQGPLVFATTRYDQSRISSLSAELVKYGLHAQYTEEFYIYCEDAETLVSDGIFMTKSGINYPQGKVTTGTVWESDSARDIFKYYVSGCKPWRY